MPNNHNLDIQLVVLEDQSVKMKSHLLSSLVTEDQRGSAFAFLQKLHLVSIMVWMPTALVIVIYACGWANIFGEAGNYNDPKSTWQSCLTATGYVTVPLNATISNLLSNVQAQQQNSSDCILNTAIANAQYCSDPYAQVCLQEVATIKSLCVPPSATPIVNNINIPLGSMLTALSYTGIQALIFSAAGLASLNRALRHPTWLPSTIALLIWFSFSILTYYTVNPILPVPQQTNSTLLIFLIYGFRPSQFNYLNHGDNQCTIATNYVWVYLIFVLLIFGITIFNLILAIIGEIIKIEDNKSKVYERLTKTEYPCILAVFAMVFYVVIAFSKIYSSANTLQAISDYDVNIFSAAAAQKLWYPPTWFPFKQPGLDLGTILYIGSFMSIIRGYTMQSVSAFKLSFVLAIVYALAGYPPLVGALQFYTYNNFGNDDSCNNYFLASNTGFFGYPNTEQAQQYCRAFRAAIAGGIGLLLVMHGIAAASFVAFRSNEKRKSFVGTPFDAERFSSKDVPNLSKDNNGTAAVPIAQVVSSLNKDPQF